MQSKQPKQRSNLPMMSKNFYGRKRLLDKLDRIFRNVEQTFLGTALLSICCAGICLAIALFIPFGVWGLILSVLGVILFFFCGWVIGRWLFK